MNLGKTSPEAAMKKLQDKAVPLQQEVDEMAKLRKAQEGKR